MKHVSSFSSHIGYKFKDGDYSEDVDKKSANSSYYEANRLRRRRDINFFKKKENDEGVYE